MPGSGGGVRLTLEGAALGNGYSTITPSTVATPGRDGGMPRPRQSRALQWRLRLMAPDGERARPRRRASQLHSFSVGRRNGVDSRR